MTKSELNELCQQIEWKVSHRIITNVRDWLRNVQDLDERTTERAMAELARRRTVR